MKTYKKQVEKVNQLNKKIELIKGRIEDYEDSLQGIEETLSMATELKDNINLFNEIAFSNLFDFNNGKPYIKGLNKNSLSKITNIKTLATTISKIEERKDLLNELIAESKKQLIAITPKSESLRIEFLKHGYLLDVSVYPFAIKKQGKEIHERLLPKFLKDELDIYYDYTETFKGSVE